MSVSYRMSETHVTIIERLVAGVIIRENDAVVYSSVLSESIKLEHALFFFLFLFYDFLIHFVLKYRLHSRLNDFKRVVFLH